LSKSNLFRALKWSFAGELASRAIQPLVFILLARLLTPDDYGVMAAAVMIISFTQIFWEAGISKALIQKQEVSDEVATTGFWINVVTAVVISFSLLALSSMIANFLFQDARVSRVLQVMTLHIILGALASIPTALMQKEMKFNQLFWVKIATVALPAFFSLPMAIYGFSYWALVVGTLAGQLAQVIVLFWISSWRPKFSFNQDIARQLSRFGLWVGLSGVLGWFFLWVDSLFIGSYMGTHTLGIYRTGNQFVTMIFGIMFSPLLPVLYSRLSRAQDNREWMRNSFMRIFRIMTFVAIPIGFILFAVATPVSGIVFGDKWMGIDLVVGTMALTHGFAWIVGANGEVYRAMGKPSYESAVNCIASAVYIVGYYVSIQYGFETFVWTRFALALGAILLHLFFSWYVLRISVFYFLRVVVVATVTGSVALGVSHFLSGIVINPLWQIIIVGLSSVVVMIPILWVIEKNGLIKDVLSLVGEDKILN
jgi:O-antigen/teichoic acid export membrane protein